MNKILNYFKTFFYFYIRSLLQIKNLNTLFFYSYLIFLILGIFLIYKGVFYKEKLKKVKREKTKLTANDLDYLINKLSPLKKIIDLISQPLTLINFKPKIYNDIVALIFLSIYGMVLFLLIPYINKFAFMWYTRLVNYIVLILLPIALINLYLGVIRSGISKDLPEAFSEIFSSYRNSKKLRTAIDEAIEYMPGKAKKEFKILLPYLQSEQTFDYGLDLFEKRLNNSTVTLFCEIIRTSRFKNSDISTQLEHLAVKSRGRQYIKEKAKKQLVWYEFFILGWLFSVPAVMNFVQKISEEAYKFYFSMKGGMLLTVTIIICLISIIIIHFLQEV